MPVSKVMTTIKSGQWAGESWWCGAAAAIEVVVTVAKDMITVSKIVVKAPVPL